MSFKLEDVKFENKDQLYKFMNVKMVGLLSPETDWLANMSNASALIWMMVEDLNWAGFYLSKNGKLVLGPFQGKPACVNIEIGKGVCGTAALSKEAQLVKNVHEFPGHIACDSASNSELVMPIIVNDEVVGVLDLDSPTLNRFDEEDLQGFGRIIKTLIKYIDWDSIS